MKKVFAAECSSISGRDLAFDTTIAIGFDKDEIIMEAESQFRRWTRSEKSDREILVVAYDYLGTDDEFDFDMVDYESGYEEIFSISAQ